MSALGPALRTQYVRKRDWYRKNLVNATAATRLARVAKALEKYEHELRAAMAVAVPSIDPHLAIDSVHAAIRHITHGWEKAR